MSEQERPFTVDYYIELVESWPDLAREALGSTEDTAQLVDVLGSLNATTSALGRVKRRHQVELENGDEGRTWRIRQGRKANRSFNLMGLVLKFQEKWGHKSALVTIMQLIEHDVLRVSWQWTKLRETASNYGVDLVVGTDRKVESGDPAFDVGELWVDDSMGYERVSEEG